MTAPQQYEYEQYEYARIASVRAGDDDSNNCWKGIPFGAIPAAFGAGATWLVSSVTHPLVAAVFAPATICVATLALMVLKKMGIVQELNMSSYCASLVATNIVLSLAMTAIGFPISIPLSLLLSATTAAGLFIALCMV